MRGMASSAQMRRRQEAASGAGEDDADSVASHDSGASEEDRALREGRERDNGGFMGLEDLEDVQDGEFEDEMHDEALERAKAKASSGTGGDDVDPETGLPTDFKKREIAIMERSGEWLQHVPVTSPLEDGIDFVAPTAVVDVGSKFEETAPLWPERHRYVGSTEEDEALENGGALQLCVVMAERMDAQPLGCRCDGKESSYQEMEATEQRRNRQAQRRIDSDEQARLAESEGRGPRFPYVLPYASRAVLRCVSATGRTYSVEVPMRPFFYVRVDVAGQRWKDVDTLALEAFLEAAGHADEDHVRCYPLRRRHALQIEMDPADPLRPRTYAYLKCEFPSDATRRTAARALQWRTPVPEGVDSDDRGAVKAARERVEQEACKGGEYEAAFLRQRVSTIEYKPWVAARRLGRRKRLVEQPRSREYGPGGFLRDEYASKFGDRARPLKVVMEENRMPQHVHTYRALGVQPFDWFELPEGSYAAEWRHHPDPVKRPERPRSTCDAHLVVKGSPRRASDALRGLPDRKDLPPLLEVAYDIEQRGRLGKFPEAKDPYCKVTAICMTLQWSCAVPPRAQAAIERCRRSCLERRTKVLARDGEPDAVGPDQKPKGPLKANVPFLRVALCAQKCTGIRGCVVESLPNEKDLLRRLFHVLTELLDADTVVSWNGWRYDDYMTHDRSEFCMNRCQRYTHWIRDP